MEACVTVEASTTMQEMDLRDGPAFGPGEGTITVGGLPGTGKWVIPPDDWRLVVHVVFRDEDGRVITWAKTHVGHASFTLTARAAEMTYWTEWALTLAEIRVTLA